MKKMNFDKKPFTIALLAIFVICTSIFFENIVSNFPNIWDNASTFLSRVSILLKPFIYAFCIAFILKAFVNLMEQSSLKDAKVFNGRPKLLRFIAIIISYLVVFIFIGFLLQIVVPDMVNSISTLVTEVPSTMANLTARFNAMSQDQNSYINNLNSDVLSYFGYSIDTAKLEDYFLTSVINFTKAMPSVFTSIVSGTFSVAQTLLNIVLGFVIAFYMLMDKESFSDFFKKLTRILFTEEKSLNIFRIANMTDKIFTKFFIGKSLDSLIIGCIFYVSCVILKIPYALLFSIIITVTNMIPYFGPFIGAIPIILITLLYNFKSAVFIGIAILALQQFDGIVLGPKILGDSTGLKPISVIFAILIGGGFFGVFGMLVGVPIFAVISVLINEFLDTRYKKTYYGAKHRNDENNL